MKTQLGPSALLALLLAGALAAQDPPAPAPPPETPAPTPPAPAPPTPAPPTPAPETPPATTPAPPPRTPSPRAPSHAAPIVGPVAPAKLPVMMSRPRAPALGSELLDSPVTDFDGQTLGSVVDLVFSGQGEMVAVVKRNAGDLTCVPMSRLLPRLRKAAPDEARPEETKVVPTEHVESFIFSEDPAWLASAEAIASVEAVDAAAIKHCRENFLGRDATPAPPESESACRPLSLAQMLAGSVKDSAGAKVGSVKDVAVNLCHSRPAYLLFLTAGTGGRLHGAAAGLMRCDDEGPSLQLPMTETELRGAVNGIDSAHLPLVPDLPAGASGAVVELPRA